MSTIDKGIDVFYRVVNAGIDSASSEKTARQVRLINKLAVAIFLLTVSIGTTFYLLTFHLSILIPAAIESCLSICPLFLNRKRKYIAASLVTFLVQCIASLYFGMLLRPALELQTVIFFLLMISFILFDQLKTRRLSWIIALLILIVLEANGYIKIIDPIILPIPYSIIFKCLSFGGLFCLIAVVGYPYVISHDVNYRLKNSLKTEESNNNAKSIFIRHLSHEIQSNFKGVLRHAYIMRNALTADKESVDLTNQLIEKCQLYKQMSTNLLEYTKIDAGVVEEINLQPVSIRNLMCKYSSLHNQADEKGVTIELTFDDDMPDYILCDELRITLVFNNLLSNAIKFTKSKSVVKVFVKQANLNWTLTIEDEGGGISKEKINAIFDPYVTEKKDTDNPEGIGLGLYVTKHIVENLLNGTIGAYNKASGGAVFKVTLPLLRVSAKKLSVDSFN